MYNIYSINKRQSHYQCITLITSVQLFNLFIVFFNLDKNTIIDHYFEAEVEFSSF